jgi:hypothetical protein
VGERSKPGYVRGLLAIALNHDKEMKVLITLIRSVISHICTEIPHYTP